jgi:acyl dehydratase
LRSAYTVVSARVSKSRPALGVVMTKNRMFNQRGETVFTLEWSYLIERREKDAVG